MEMTLDAAVEALIEAIKDDYLTYTLQGAAARQRDATRKGSSRNFDLEGLSEINQKMVAEFNGGFEVRKGKKYIKIISNRSVWGFIVAEDGGKFPKGTILKAASWSAPAKNHSRGNILTGGYTIRWTGPLYM